MPDNPATAAALLHAAAVPQNAERLLQRLEWRVIKRLDGLLQGDYRTLLRGTGIDLADLREYQLHDDVRHIDWNVTARLDTPHVRVFTEDREMTAWFLLDLSPSVDFGPPGQTKRDQLTGFVAVLSRLLTRHGNRVGAILHGQSSRDTVLPAGTGRRHVLQLMHHLQRPASAAAQPAAAPGGLTQLHLLLQKAHGFLRRRSAVFVVSDFMSAPGWERALAQLSRRHDVVAVRLLDPLELELPNVGLVWMRDPETGEQLHVDTRSPAFRRRYARLAAERETQLRDGLMRSGADTLELATDDGLLDSMMRFMSLRGARSRHVSRASAG